MMWQKAKVLTMRTRYLFVGAKRSDRAIKMGVVWADGRLAAKQLFDALKACGIEPREHAYTNMFEPCGYRNVVHAYSRNCVIVGMGKKVHHELTRLRVPHLELIHPAARGRIRLKANYNAHVKAVLG